MGVTPVELQKDYAISEEVARKVKRFLLNDEDRSFPRKDSSSSYDSDTSERRICPDTEKEAGVKNWGEPLANGNDSADTEEQSSYNWLFRCDIRCYSDGEYLLVTWHNRFVVLDKPPSADEFRITCKKEIGGAENEETYKNRITSSCLFGLANSRHSDQLDCVIVALGTMEGCLYFYTEKGTLLFFDRFSIYEQISQVVFEHVKASHVLLVVLSRKFFVVNAISLNSVLHQAKSLIARGENTAEELSDTLQLQCELIDPEVKSDIIHVVYTGLHKPTTFDQYVSASWQSFNARVERPSLPTYSTFAVTTETCFVSFVWHDRDAGDQIWNEAIKYGKSLLPSFGIRKYFGFSSEPARKAPHMYTAQLASARSRILDPRIAQTVSRSPDGRYLAIVDTTARVILIDVSTRTQVLIWKGYRDASIAWLSSLDGKRFAQFLAIFAPRRSLLEVWTVLGNVRVCARHVTSQECDLLQGGEQKTLCEATLTHTQNNAFFVNEKGEFNRLVVPFHLALNSRASQDQHDQLLLSKIESLPVTSPQWFETFSAFKVSSSRIHALTVGCEKLESVEEAKIFFEEMHKIPSALALGLDKLSHAIELYRRLAGFSGSKYDSEKEEQSTDEEILGNMDATVKTIVQLHLEQELEEQNNVDKLTLSDWLRLIDWNSEGTTDLFTSTWNDVTRLRLSALVFSRLFNLTSSRLPAGAGKCDERISVVLKDIPFSKIQIAQLFCQLIEVYPHSLDEQWFCNVVRMLVDLGTEEGGVLEMVERKILESSQISRAIVLMAACWCSRIVMKRRRKNEKDRQNEKELSEKISEAVIDDNEDGNEGESLLSNGNTGEEEEAIGDVEESFEDAEWEAVSPETEHIDSALLCMHGAVLAQKLTTNKKTMARVADILPRVDAYCREMVAKWAVQNEASREYIEKVFPTDPTEVLGDEDTPEAEERRHIEIDIPTEEDEIVNRLAKMMSRTFEHDLVVADIAWELMGTWFRERNDQFDTIKRCTKFLSALVDVRLRHGVARLIWDKFVTTPFETLAALVEKTGRSPKEREARKELGFSETRVVEFIAQCEKLLEILMDAVRDTPIARLYKHDALIEMSNTYFSTRLSSPSEGLGSTLTSSASSSSASLATWQSRDDQLSSIALRQSLVNYHLVLHHLHLTMALRLQLTVGLRLHPLRTLFCSVGNRALFCRLDTHPLIPLDRVDDAVMERRHMFLTKVAEQGSTDERRLAKTLAGEWNLTVDSITLMQALSAFRSGNDSQGVHELVGCVRNDRAAAALARVLAGRIVRLSTEANTTLTSTHSSYLCNVAGDETARVDLYDEDGSHGHPDDVALTSDLPTSTSSSNPTTWRDAVVSLGRASAGFAQTPHAAVPFVRLNDIAQQYWGISWMD